MGMWFLEPWLRTETEESRTTQLLPSSAGRAGRGRSLSHRCWERATTDLDSVVCNLLTGKKRQRPHGEKQAMSPTSQSAKEQASRVLESQGPHFCQH